MRKYPIKPQSNQGDFVMGIVGLLSDVVDIARMSVAMEDGFGLS